MRLAATMIYLSEKQYFDFKLDVDILFKSQGVGGIAFRVKDEFNYYAFIIDKSLGHKAIAKVTDSKVVLLKTINDGGILINNWHTVSITVRAGLISVYIYDKESAQKSNSEKKLEVEDFTYTKGSLGFFVNGLEGFYFDEFKVTPIKCFSPWQPIPYVEINNSAANIYSEDFSGSFLEKYTIIDIEEGNSHNGPSKWTFENDYVTLSNIKQSSDVYDISGRKRPTIALINYVNFSNGSFGISFKPCKKEGMISIILKYSRIEEETGPIKEEFYSFDMHNEETESYFTFRKWSNGVPVVLKRIVIETNSKIPRSSLNLAFIENEINHVIVESINQKITIRISQDNGKTFLDIINILDESYKAGAVGFGTFKTCSEFTRIHVEPPKLKLTQKDLDLIMTKSMDDIPLPSVTDIHNISIVSDCTKNQKFYELSAVSTIMAYSGILGSAMGNDFCSSVTTINQTITNSSSSLTSTFDKNFINSGNWKVCVVSRSESERNKYCQDTFDSEILRKRCEVSFKIFKTSSIIKSKIYKI